MSDASLTLAIDTAAPRLQLALGHGAERIETLIEPIATGHAERIFSAIDALMARLGVGYGDLARLVVTTGPGSFTGLRIGISAARGIALARGRPIVGVPSLLALSLSAPAGAPVDVLLDARRGEAYFQRFSAPGVPESSAQLLSMDVAQAQLRPGVHRIESPFVDIAAVLVHGLTLDPLRSPPDPAYIREADAKPQTDKRIERR